MINKVTLIGRVGGDPDVRKLENGTSVGRFSLATSDAYKDKSEQWVDSTEWHNLVVWRDLAERAEKSVKKGSLIYAEGKITYRKYNDKDGHEKTVTDIVVSTFRILDGRKESVMTGEAFPGNEPQQQSQKKDFFSGGNSGGGDDLPF